MTLRSGKDHYVLGSWLHGPPNRFYPLIGNDVSAAEKADSFTFAGALVDGCHAMPQNFVEVVQERCASVEGSKFVGVANPEGPQHWYKLNLVDQTDGEEALNFPFELADNETLTQRQIERLYRIYPPGPMRDRPDIRQVDCDARSRLSVLRGFDCQAAEGRAAVPSQHKH